MSYLVRRDDVDPERIGGLGLSVGGELLMRTAARDGRLRAVVSEGPGRQSLNDQLQITGVPKALRWLSPMTMETAAGVVLANRRPPGGLVDAVPRIAPRPVLLISSGRGNPDEELNAAYREAGGPTVSHWRSRGRATPVASPRHPPSTSGAWSGSSTTSSSAGDVADAGVAPCLAATGLRVSSDSVEDLLRISRPPR